MEKRVVFSSKWLPYALVAPQIAVTIVFFFWPAVQAVYYSFLVQDPFGLSTQWVWFQNYQELLRESQPRSRPDLRGVRSTVGCRAAASIIGRLRGL